MSEKFSAVILAAGCGKRMNMDIPKQRVIIGECSVLYRTVLAFQSCDYVDEIIVVTRSEDLSEIEEELSNISKLSNVVIGGKTRAESAKIGFESIKASAKYVAIHDGARCFVNKKMLDSVFCDAVRFGAATASSKITDSVKAIDKNGFIKQSVDREYTVLVQTPQIFRCDLYKRALDETDVYDKTITDDNSMLEKIGIPVYCTDTGKENFKITHKEDLDYAEYYLGRLEKCATTE